MTHCRECNSEIAEAEAFCPYCGISINPTPISDPAVADEPPEEKSDESGPADGGVTEFDMSETIVTGSGGPFEKFAPDVSAAADEQAESGEGLESEELENGEDGGFVDISEIQSDSGKIQESADFSEPESASELEAESKIPEIVDSDAAEEPSLQSPTDTAIDEEEKEIDEALAMIDGAGSSKPGKTAGELVSDVAKEEDSEMLAADVFKGDSAEQAKFGETPAIVEDSGAEEPETIEASPELVDDFGIDEAEKSEAGSSESGEIPPIVDAAEFEETLISASAVEVEVVEGAEAIPSEAIPSDAIPSEAIPSEAAPADAIPAESVGDVSQMEETLVGGVHDTEAAPSALESPDSEESETSVPREDSEHQEPEDSFVVGADMEFGKAPAEATLLNETDLESEKEEPAEYLAGEAAGTATEDQAPDAEAGISGETPMTTPNIGVGDTDGSKTPKLRPLDEGTVLNDRYEIVRKIGGGGMGAVYLASDRNLGGVLRAVKEMVQSYIEHEQQEKAVQDFKRESMLLTSLEHPSIPTIYDYFYDEAEARFYLVMKYISGGDLAARLRSAPEGRLDEMSVTRWAIEIADVLAYLHDRQPPIVYRDLKPANIMIDGNTSKIMLIDFGIARWINKEEKGVTAVGTMGYAPPELFSGNVVPSSDIYSLGSTMFHLLTGADPQNNPLLIFDFQKHPRPRQINPNLSDQMEQILMRAVEYNADRRFMSAAEMRDALRRHLDILKTGQVSYGIKKTPTSIALSDQPVFCGFCGQKIVATDMFCAFCGAKQPLAQPGVQSQDYVLPQVTARLVVEGTGDLTVPTFDLGKKENLVGRRDPMSNIFPEVDLSKYDPQTKISRKHARIWRDGDIYMLEDLGSSNGTMVIQANNDTTRLAPHQSRALNSGDRIQVGDTTLHFVLG